MKVLFFGSLSALLLTLSGTALATPVKDNQSNSDTPILSQATFNFNVPHITNSGIRNDTHFIRLAVKGMSLQNLIISLPSQMERFNGVQITDQSGKEITAKTEISKERLLITFDQPIATDSSLEVELIGVRRKSLSGNILLYGVSGQRVGLMGEIPIGTARIDIPEKG
jgi:hypothetical protein